MNEILEKMLSSEILSEETRTELMTAFSAELEAAKEVAIAEAKVEFANKFAEDKAQLVEALDTKVTAMLQEEIAELKEDIERFRDLEAEYAAKLVEEKEALGLQVKADMAELVETLDVFLEERLGAEMVELKESIEEVKKIKFAQKLFENFESVYKERFFDETGIKAQLDESASALEKANNELNAVSKRLSDLEREKEMARVLEPLHGRPREIMEAILKSIPTESLAERYDSFIGRVLHESVTVENKSEKESVNTSVLAENDSTAEEPVAPTVVVTGDSTVVENVVDEPTKVLSESEKARLQKIAGISRR